MKFYKYWVRVEKTLMIDGKPVVAKFVGKSNISPSHAAEEAGTRALRVQQRIDGKKPVVREDYSEDIREEITQDIDRNNIITRTRYGARILNTTTLTILDIDEHRKGFWELLGFKKRENKAAIIDDLEKKVAPLYPRLGFRVYETTKGIRVILLGDYLDPSKPEAKTLMTRTHTDPLYARLCVRQKCYRARLTPKPSRMKIKGFKYIWPLDAGIVDAARSWVERYEAEAIHFSTCRFIKTIGRESALSTLINFHDQATGALLNRKLA